MIDYFLDNWGSFASALGVIVSVGGLAAALIAVYRAGKARDAATAAEFASEETRSAITRVLTTVDLERAKALVQRLMALHRASKWDASLEHYPTLRVMLADIDSRHPDLTPELHNTLKEAVPQITVIEDNVDRAIREGRDPSGLRNFNRVLNSIHSDLTQIASSTQFTRSETEE